MRRDIPYYLTAAVAGLIFGAGLYVSQMIDAYKVLHFLDLTAIPTGGWDPSLAFVMVGGLVVMVVTYRLFANRQAPLFDKSFYPPVLTKVDTQLVVGATLFGVGWGMSGICPGPGIALIAFGPENLLVLLLAMFAGSYAGTFVVPGGREKRLALAQ
jgi:uncharacterized membrane protein YedE/YeeE